MMNNTDIHKEFVGALAGLISKKTKLADFIAHTLGVEKESAYRRIRGEVQFSLREAILIAGRLNLSLDEITVKSSGNRIKNLLELPVMSSDVESEKDGKRLVDDALSFLKEFVKQPVTEYGLAVNGIPFPLFQNYSMLSRFYILKYLHHSDNPQTYLPFEKIFESPAQIEAGEDFYRLYRQINSTYHIWNRNIVPALIADVQYFRSIYLINESEVRELKAELLRFFDDLEETTAAGKFKETGNKFDFYVSDLNIDTTYCYFDSEKIRLALFTAFFFFATATQKESLVNKICEWIKSMQRCSTLISGNAAKERILFFDSQRAIIDTL